MCDRAKTLVKKRGRKGRANFASSRFPRKKKINSVHATARERCVYSLDGRWLGSSTCQFIAGRRLLYTSGEIVPFRIARNLPVPMLAPARRSEPPGVKQPRLPSIAITLTSFFFFFCLQLYFVKQYLFFNLANSIGPSKLTCFINFLIVKIPTPIEHEAFTKQIVNVFAKQRKSKRIQVPFERKKKKRRTSKSEIAVRK